MTLQEGMCTQYKEHKYTIHTNKCMEQLSNKPTTTSMRKDMYENAHIQAVVVELSRS